jgi:hypothetical protein
MGTGENSGPGGPGPVGLHGVSAELQKTLGLAKANLPSRPVRAFACSALHGDGCVASCPELAGPLEPISPFACEIGTTRDNRSTHNRGLDRGAPY